MDELERILSEDKKKETSPPSLEAKPQTEKTEAEKAAEELANLKKAKEEALKELRELRQEKSKLKNPSQEEELPKIDFEDPSAKAWDKHVNQKVSPLKDELEKEKEEVRSFALESFLADKPALAKDPEKVKKLIGTYQKLAEGQITEKTQEGVLTVLRKAYAAEFSDEILQEKRAERVGQAKANILASDIAVSRGATSYPKETTKLPPIDDEAKKILAKWGMTEKEYYEDVKALGS